jgi:hypothetical protein
LIAGIFRDGSWLLTTLGPSGAKHAPANPAEANTSTRNADLHCKDLLTDVSIVRIGGFSSVTECRVTGGSPLIGPLRQAVQPRIPFILWCLPLPGSGLATIGLAAHENARLPQNGWIG